ncbi:MAG: hypothetical protein HN353_10685 [Bdellovibrionales bacterium]|jgi:hypothetical protein|nr:hypothetical protein [Bdellovibrionales bacterium]MBT3524760.1 hypothetical protein [Bdellovibrionales bacterium]MBT7669335.1 hypothetical protein [Bdellovibrionales bacterium]MBT7767649.1 hypothetical protein [Bdellovibrionales bacterium]
MKVRIVIAISILLITSLYGQEYPGVFQCRQDSKVPLFFNQFDPIEIELTTDYNKINDPSLYPEDAKSTLSSGKLKYYNQLDGINLDIEVKVRARGGYRFEECDYRPLKVIISKQEKKRIKKRSPNNIFRKMGRKLKFTTICSQQDQTKAERTLFKELYIYKLLGLFNSTTLKVRLVKLTMKLPDGSNYLTSYAFIRETPKRVAQRCNLQLEPQIYIGWDNELRKSYQFTFDQNRQKIPFIHQSAPGSRFQAELYNQFIYNNDYSFLMRHNIINLLAPGNLIYHLTYDYDLGFVVDGGIYNTSNDNGESAPAFTQWITEYSASEQIKKEHLSPFVDQRNNMLEMISRSSLLDNKGKQEMLTWLTSYLAVIDNYLSHK